jgi:hypothetical protein
MEDLSESTSWINEIASMRNAIIAMRKIHWMRDLNAEPPGRGAVKLLRASRHKFYACDILDIIELFDNALDNPSPESVTDLLAGRYFEPTRDWKRFLLEDGHSEIRLWYQSWPVDAASTVIAPALMRYSIEADLSTKPDIVIEKFDPETTSQGIVLELKATKRPRYLAEGFQQLLGYLSDRPEWLAQIPSGWLVAPDSDAFISVASDQLPIWVVSADSVASAAVSRFTSPPIQIESSSTM